MKWIAISGSWRQTNKKVREDVRREVKEILQKGDGFISGGALGVDYIATDEALKLDPKAERIRIFLPTDLKTYLNHYYRRAREGVITRDQARILKSQLEKLVETNKDSVIENPNCKKVNKKTYYERISRIIKMADELKTFQVNDSEGTQYGIDKAKQKGIPIEIFIYTIRN